MTGELCYFTIGAADSDRARTFYGALLGWQFAPGNVPGGWHITGASPPGGLHGGAPEPGIDVYFQVEDIRAAVARVRELGGEAGDVQETAAGAYAGCRDDQGIRFNLFAPGTTGGA
jgi:predicted enzyme related to lactoylglutathione lyase